MQWSDFTAACPQIATRAKDRFARDQVVLVGTLRRDGSARISPVEPDFVEGQLVLGMMWRSRKARDLLRDPRVVVHSTPADRQNVDGDVKIYGRATDVADQAFRAAYEDVIAARIDWRPPEPYHCFVVEVESAAYVRFGEATWESWTWSPAAGLHTEQRPND